MQTVGEAVLPRRAADAAAPAPGHEAELPPQSWHAQALSLGTRMKHDNTPPLTTDRRIHACPEIRSAYPPAMSTIQEIETAVAKLSRQELLAFRDWFSEFDAAAWDRQFAEDVSAGHLDALADEAIRDLREGRCRDL